jgi:conjugative transfer signal peptidase TraF
MTVANGRHQKEVTLRVMSVATIVLVSMFAMGWFGGFRINTTPSYPLGLWRIRPLARDARVGDRVFICPPNASQFRNARERGYLRRGLCEGGFGPLIKTIVATANQSVDVGDAVMIDGQPLHHSDVSATDTAGRPLAVYSGGPVPSGFVFVHSDFPGSFDSRYFGPIQQNGVLGLAHEVLTHAP